MKEPNFDFTILCSLFQGDGPEPEEIFTALAINERHIALKSGYGRYLKVEKDGIITGRSEAVGGLEQFEPVFQVAIPMDFISSFTYTIHEGLRVKVSTRKLIFR